jgi:hypothetical protein
VEPRLYALNSMHVCTLGGKLCRRGQVAWTSPFCSPPGRGGRRRWSGKEWRDEQIMLQNPLIPPQLSITLKGLSHETEAV